MIIAIISLSACDIRTPEQIYIDEKTAAEQAVIEQEIDNKRRMKIVECDHTFQAIGTWYSNQKIMCPKCGVKQSSWENNKF